jgi:hypothetical protein
LAQAQDLVGTKGFFNRLRCVSNILLTHTAFIKSKSI